MATAVYNREEIELLDGSTLELKAMNIKNRRRFMKSYNELVTSMPETTPETEDEFMAQAESFEDGLLKLIPYCVAGQRPEWDNIWSKDAEEAETALDSMLDALDTDTVQYIIKQVAGIDLKAQNEMVMNALKESGGTN